MNFVAKVEAKYTVAKFGSADDMAMIEANIIKDKILGLAKKSMLLLAGVGLFNSMASGMTFSEQKLQDYAKTTTKAFHDSGIDCKVQTHFKKLNAKSFSATFQYVCSDGSVKVIKITQLGDMNTSIDVGETKNKEGYVDSTIEYTADSMLGALTKELRRDGFKVK
jgi:hypothetical protein